jgi:hypothetical protein
VPVPPFLSVRVESQTSLLIPRLVAVPSASASVPLKSLNAGCTFVNAPVVELYDVKNWLPVAVVFAGSAGAPARSE